LQIKIRKIIKIPIDSRLFGHLYYNDKSVYCVFICNKSGTDLIRALRIPGLHTGRYTSGTIQE
jgi:hypothetical protein